MRKFFIKWLLIICIGIIVLTAFLSRNDSSFDKKGTEQGICFVSNKYIDDSGNGTKAKRAAYMYRVEFEGKEYPDLSLRCPESFAVVNQKQYYELKQGTSYRVWYTKDILEGNYILKHFKEDNFD